MRDRDRGFLATWAKIEPGVSLSQWLYERLSNNWALLLSLFGGGGVMSYFASITDWIVGYGPAAIWGTGIASALVAWIALSLVAWLLARASESRARATAVEQWKNQVDTVNPLDSEFHKRRIKISDLCDPTSRSIKGKKFIGCELVGPANILLRGTSQMANSTITNCDVAVMQMHTKVRLFNVISLEDISIFDCTIWNCTVFIRPGDVAEFKALGAPFLTLTGDPKVDIPQTLQTNGTA